MLIGSFYGHYVTVAGIPDDWPDRVLSAIWPQAPAPPHARDRAGRGVALLQRAPAAAPPSPAVPPRAGPVALPDRDDVTLTGPQGTRPLITCMVSVATARILRRCLNS